MVDHESQDRSPEQGAPATAGDQAGASTARPSGGRRARGCLFEIIQTVALTLVLFLGIQTFVAQPFQVQMHSMDDTFLEGDYVLIDRLSDLWSPYRRGEVVVFEPPASWAAAEDHPFIKRVIGVGGDTIEIREDGEVVVNGVVIDEPYLHRDASGTPEPTDPNGFQRRWTVPQGDLFVMGDHRRMSADSRIFGPIPASSVVGRAVLRYWPFSKFGGIETATYDNLPAR